MSTFILSENSYSRDGRSYSVKDLIEASKDLPTFEIDLRSIDISVMPWGDVSIQMFSQHMKRVNDADLKYPVILDWSGYICDGWHRVVKAIVLGHDTIKARRLTVMPDCISSTT